MAIRPYGLTKGFFVEQNINYRCLGFSTSPKVRIQDLILDIRQLPDLTCINVIENPSVVILAKARI
jgi:hypothetical protein